MLMVDNDRDMCRVVADVLKEEGISVSVVTNGKRALEKLKAQSYDGMILDYKLSGMSGLAVLEKAREMRPSMTTVMISGYGNEFVRRRAQELGAYALLDKPFDIKELIRVVKKALKKIRRGGVMKKLSIVGMVLLITAVSVIFTLSAKEAVAATQRSPDIAQSMVEPAKASLASVGAYLPKLGGLLLILVIGSLIAVGIAKLIGWLLKLIRLEAGAKKIKVPEILKKGGIGLSLSELVIEIVFFLIIIVTLITALEFYGLSTNALTGQILSYIPSVIAAAFVLIIGILSAILLSGIITLVGGNMRIAQSATLGVIAKYAIIVVAGLIALKELGAGAILTDRSKDIVLGGIVLALALGAKDKAGDLLNKVFKKSIFEVYRSSPIK